MISVLHLETTRIIKHPKIALDSSLCLWRKTRGVVTAIGHSLYPMWLIWQMELFWKVEKLFKCMNLKERSGKFLYINRSNGWNFNK